MIEATFVFLVLVLLFIGNQLIVLNRTMNSIRDAVSPVEEQGDVLSRLGFIEERLASMHAELELIDSGVMKIQKRFGG